MHLVSRGKQVHRVLTFNRVARQLSGRTDLVVQGDCLVEKVTGAILAKISEFSPKL